MYHSVKISLLDRETHRFHWRNLSAKTSPDTFVTTTVSFGDKPAGAIAQTALRKTVDMSKDKYPDAWKTITQNTHMDDILNSVPSIQKAVRLTEDIDQKGEINSETPERDEFKLTDDKTETMIDNQKVLGVKWDLQGDKIYFSVNLNFERTSKQRKLKLSEISSQYDMIKYLQISVNV